MKRILYLTLALIFFFSPNAFSQCYTPPGGTVCSSTGTLTNYGYFNVKYSWDSIKISQNASIAFRDSSGTTSNTDFMTMEIYTKCPKNVQIWLKYGTGAYSKFNLNNYTYNGQTGNEHIYYTGYKGVTSFVLIRDSCGVNIADTGTIYIRKLCEFPNYLTSFGNHNWVENIYKWTNPSISTAFNDYLGSGNNQSLNFTHNIGSTAPTLQNNCVICPTATSNDSFAIEYRMDSVFPRGFYHIVCNTPNDLTLTCKGSNAELFNYWTNGSSHSTKVTNRLIRPSANGGKPGDTYVVTSTGKWIYQTKTDTGSLLADFSICKMDGDYTWGNNKWNAYVYDYGNPIYDGYGYQGTFSSDSITFAYSWPTQPTLNNYTCGVTMDDSSYLVTFLMRKNFQKGRYKIRVKSQQGGQCFLSDSNGVVKYYISNTSIGSSYDITSPYMTLSGDTFLTATVYKYNTSTAKLSFVSCREPKDPGPIHATRDTACVGDQVTLTVDTADGTETQWYKKSCAGTGGLYVGSGASITVTMDTSTTFYVRNRNRAYASTDTANNLEIFSANCSNKRIIALSIDTSVHAGIVSSNLDSVCWLKPVALYVTGDNGDLQWQRKDTNNTWINIIGANNDTLVEDSFLMNTSYRVIARKNHCSFDTSNVKSVSLRTDFDCIYLYNWYFLLVHTVDTNNIPLYTDSIITLNDSLNNLLEQLNVSKFNKPFHDAKTPYLNEVYALYCGGEIDSFYEKIKGSNFFDTVELVPCALNGACVNPVATNDPYLPSGYSSNWAMDIIDAECAWSVTTGNPDVVVGIVDGEFDISHEDLNGKFVSVTGSNNVIGLTIPIHGTPVSSCVAVNTNNSKGIAGIGYSVSLAGHLVDNGNLFGLELVYPWPGIWDAYQHGRNVIVSSASGISCPGGEPCGSFIVGMAVQEIIDNNSVLVVAAGNDADEHHQNYSDIPGVIVVGGIDENNLAGTLPYSKYSKIDLCAPAFQVPVAFPGNTYGTYNGTSFAAPIVAGTIGLLLSINPCLTPSGIEDILKSTTDPITDASLYPGLLGSGKLNAYQACLMAGSYIPDNTPEFISGDVHWDHDKHITHDIVVLTGSKLTIDPGVTIHMGAGDKITVQPGAKLIVDDAEITGICQSPWEGMMIQGNKTAPQDLSSNDNMVSTSSNQGFVFLRDAIIKDARTALIIWDTNDGWVSSVPSSSIGGTGGIVRAVNTTFINNQKAAEFMSYHYASGGYEQPNKSFFYNCNFYTTDEFLSDLVHPHSFISDWDTWGIKVLGCSFENQRTDVTTSTTAVELGNGVIAIDAGLEINDYTPSLGIGGSNVVRSNFKNLNHGLYFAGINSPHTNKVMHAKFENCLRGIRNEEVAMPTFAGNEFILGSNEATDPEEFIFQQDEGIILQQCNPFVVEQNTFEGVSGVHSTIGIRSDGTGPFVNFIRNNSFTEISAADVANRQNQGISADGLNVGLKYECNSNSGNFWWDFVVSNSQQDPSYGINTSQGTISVSSGNGFSHNNSLQIASDFQNDAKSLKLYYYNSMDLPSFYTTPTITPLHPAFIAANPCDIKFAFPSEEDPSGGGWQCCTSFTNAVSDYSSFKASLAHYKSLYSALIDGGNPPRMLAFVDTSSNGNRLRDTLALYTPNLSSSVLEIVSHKGTLLGDSILYIVMRDNAEAVTGEIMEYLDSRVHLPQRWLDTIEEHRSILTYRSYLLDSVMDFKTNKEVANYTILRLIEQDTMGFNIDTFSRWLDSCDELWAKRAKVNINIYAGRDSIALALLEHYDTTAIANSIDSVEFKNYKDFEEAYIGWIDSDSSIMKLDSTSMIDLKTIAEQNPYFKGTNIAQNILNFFYDSLYFIPAELPSEYSMKWSGTEPTQVEYVQKPVIATPTLLIFPNPAQKEITLEYRNIQESSKIFITNSLGITVYEQIASATGRTEIDIHWFNNGIYWVRIGNTETSSVFGKFVILK